MDIEFDFVVNENLLIYHIAGKIWQGIKFDSLAVYITTTKLKSAKISYSHTYNYTYGDPVPNRQI